MAAVNMRKVVYTFAASSARAMRRLSHAARSGWAGQFVRSTTPTVIAASTAAIAAGTVAGSRWSSLESASNAHPSVAFHPTVT